MHIIHGGPHGLSGDQWHWRWNPQVFAAPGYLLALVNFHGSTGRGQEFAASILGRWGDQPYQDIMSATDALIAQGRDASGGLRRSPVSSCHAVSASGLWTA